MSPEDLPAPERPASPNQGGGESTSTVIVAGAANLAIAIARAIGALLSGSAAMLSEAAHSVADTVTEVLLFIGGSGRGDPVCQPSPRLQPWGP